MNSMQFAKITLTFADDLLKLFTTELEDIVADAITVVYSAQISHIEESLKSGKFKNEARDVFMCILSQCACYFELLFIFINISL